MAYKARMAYKAKKAVSPEEQAESARVKHHQAMAERDREAEESRREAHAALAKSQPSLIVHGPAQK